MGEMRDRRAVEVARRYSGRVAEVAIRAARIRRLSARGLAWATESAGWRMRAPFFRDCVHFYFARRGRDF